MGFLAMLVTRQKIPGSFMTWLRSNESMSTAIVISGRRIKLGAACIARNAGLVDPLGRVRDPEPEQKAGRALEQGGAKPNGGERGVAGGGPWFRVTITSYRMGTLDRDNLIGGAKALRDTIASSLGMDDKDSLIEWEYGQQQTKGKTGTVVRVERLR